MEKYLQLQAELKAITDKAMAEGRPYTPEEDAKVDELQKQIAGMKKVVEHFQAQAAVTVVAAPTVPATASADGAPLQVASGGQTVGHSHVEVKHAADKQLFKTGAEQLLAIRNAGMPGGNVDKRLTLIQEKAAATGVSTGTPNEGGYLLEEEHTKEIVKAQWEVGVLSSRVSRGQMSSQLLKLPYLKNYDRTVAGGVAGGIQVYTKKEAEQYTKSKPDIGTMDFEPHKLTALYWETDETHVDIPAMNSLFQEQLPIAFADKIDYLILNGKNTDEIQGILDSSCKAAYTVPKTSGQAADTVTIANVLDIYSHLPPSLRKDAVWLCDIQVETEFSKMTVGNEPVYMQPGTGLSQAPFGTLRGIPVIPFDHCASIGEKGDLMLFVPKLYKIFQRTALNIQSSIHVRFEYGEQVWRADQRFAGKLAVPQQLKRPNGFVLSPALVLEARA